jgi:diguanylate cyclase (GGDEF)-like protein/PAS domain S-box-containing protein
MQFARAHETAAACGRDAVTLHADSERAWDILDSIGDAVVSVDTAGRITYLNATAADMTGWSREAAQGQPLEGVLRIVDGVSRESATNPLALAILRGQPATLRPNSVLLGRHGREFAIEDTATPIHDRRGQLVGAVMVFRDVSAARSLAAKMSHLAHHDILTGLPNRLLLDERLSHSIVLAHRHGKPLAVMFLDLDGFKCVNDLLGHGIGDQLLQSVARRLVACVRASDTVSRHGGDEFIVLLTELSRPEDVAGVAGKILADSKLPHRIGPHDLPVALSIGIGVYPADGADAQALLRNADLALLRAKLQGGGTFQFFGG